MTDTALRPATEPDVPAVRTVLRAAWRAAYGDVLPAPVRERAHETWHAPERLRTTVTDPDHRTTVAVRGPETDPRVVGVADASRPRPDTDPALGVVGLLYVHPDAWGQGVGTALFERAREALAELGAGRVSVRTFAGNEVGRSFYEARGLTVRRELVEELFGHEVRSVEYEAPL